MPEDVEVDDYCRQLRPRLVGTLVLLLGDVGVAEEIAQETLARVWLRWRQLADLAEAARAAWACRVAVNLGRSWLRRRVAERRALRRIGGRAEAVHVDPDTAEAVAVRRAVVALPRRQRTAVVLRFYTDLSVEEVAEVMGCAPGTVKSLTHQGLRALRDQTRVEAEEHG